MLKVKVYIRGGCCIDVEIEGGQDTDFTYDVIDFDNLENGCCPACHSDNITLPDSDSSGNCNECLFKWD